ncbi:undecaprenyldiphospho-muramoylpentapeptide beta-N-acetylglucosaminyltransferase [Candidatus Parcubacteria bacterium]|nr:undecaprenyldiphospho-muramoylpentapeptide beta-N-acetylglucosaminyltransferase [Candidatus Parcubacteria bacterium]
MSTKILFTGGGTGGHLFPIIAVAREIKRLSDNPNIQFYYIGPKDMMSSMILAQENFKIHGIPAGKIRRYFSFQNFIDILFKIPFGILQSLFFLIIARPKLVFSKGGTGAASVLIAARILFIPIFIHESDTVPGQSNRLAYRWAKKVFISFPKTEYFDLEKAILTGNPIQKELQEGKIDSAKEIFNLSLAKPVLLFLGGSQGAQPLNEFVLNNLNNLLATYELIHVCGKKNHAEVRAQSEAVLDKKLQPYYHLYEFLNELELKHAYKAADLVISRSGSGTIFEIAAIGKPAILIPLPSAAGNHQSKNAYAYAKNGAAVIVEEENLKPGLFMGKIQELISNSQKREAMGKAALEFAKPLAAKAIAREILEFLHIQ